MQNRLEDLDNADDICFLSHYFSDMPAYLNQVSETARLAGLKINKPKPKDSGYMPTQCELNRVWKSPKTSRRRYIKFFKTNDKSTLLYACEMWNMAPRDS